MTMDFTVRLRGESARLMQEMIDKGYFESKTEAIRAGILKIGLDLGLVSRQKLHQEVLDAIKKSGKKYSVEEVRRQIEAVT